jgi:fatty-acyl-CoA synthase
MEVVAVSSMSETSRDSGALPDRILDRVRVQSVADPERTAFVHLASAGDPSPTIWTIGRFYNACETAARALSSLGVRPHETIAILAPSTPDYLVAFVAAASVAIAFPVNPLLSPAAMAAQLQLSGATTVIAYGGLAGTEPHERARQAIELAPDIRLVIEMAEAPSLWRPGITSVTWSALLNADAYATDRPVKPEGPAALFHTGGTSGSPKLAELSDTALAAGPVLAALGIGWRRDDRVLNLLPYFHVGGALSISLSAIVAGATIVSCGLAGARDKGTMAALWDIIADQAVTVSVMVPTSWSVVASAPVPPRPPSLRGMVTGAATIPVDLVRSLEQQVGVPMSQLFGMTELAGICTAQPVDGIFRPHAVGYPPPSIDLAILETGEVQLGGPNLFSGYRVARDKRIDASLVLSTGDIGQLLDDGQLAITGRIKDVIIRSGHNLDPSSIEDAAYRHADVLEAAAVGMPDDYAGELPVLYVVRRTRKADPKDVLAEICALIEEPPARPKLLIDVDQMPLTPAGKIQRFRLRQDAACRKVRQLLTDMPALDIRCDDVAARRLFIGSPLPLTPEQRDLIAGRLGSLGLSAEFGPTEYAA